MNSRTRKHWLGRLAGGPEVLVGTSIAMLTMAAGYSYCPCGSARGLPFAILRPSHEGNTLTTLFVGDISRIPYELNLTGMFADIVIWSALAALLSIVVRQTLGRVLARI